MLDTRNLTVEFGKYVRRNRVLNEMSQTEVARAVGIDQSRYSRIESGLKCLDLELAIKICTYVRGDIREFINEYIEKE